jgi:hypothetical protein
MGDLLRQATAWREQDAQAVAPTPLAAPPAEAPPKREPVADLPSLLNLEGSRFVQAAYRALLLREADDNGLAAYTAELQSGRSKLEILEALSSSSEGQARGVVFAGLAEAIKARQTQRSSLWHRASRRLGLGK